MDKLEQNHCISIIRESFDNEINHLLFFFPRTGMDSFNSKMELMLWKKKDGDRWLLRDLVDYYVIWNTSEFRLNELKKEIEYNLLNERKGYFELVENIIKTNFTHVDQHMAKALDLFTTNNKRVDMLVNTVNYDFDNNLDLDEFILAIQLNFIKTLKMIEDLFNKLSPLKTTFFKVRQRKKVEVIKYDLVKISKSKWEKIFEFLCKNKFIASDIEMEDFVNLFMNKGVTEGFCMLWMDKANNSYSSKITLIEFIQTVLLDDLTNQNLFMKTYFQTINFSKNQKVPITTDNIKQSWSDFNNEERKKTSRQELIQRFMKQIIHNKVFKSL